MVSSPGQGDLKTRREEQGRGHDPRGGAGACLNTGGGEWAGSERWAPEDDI